MIKIISFTICPYVQRVAALLEAKNIAYEVENINIHDKPQWFLDISPTGQVPILITEEGTALFESDAIIEYIDDISSPLEAKLTPEERALDRAWSHQAVKNYLAQCSAQRSPDEETFIERRDKFNKALNMIDKQLKKGPYFKGETFSNVDIAWIPILHRAAIIAEHSCYDFFAKFPKIKAWQEAVLKTDAAQKSVSNRFEDAFTSFYLSDKTFLGRSKDCCIDGNTDTPCAQYKCC